MAFGFFKKKDKKENEDARPHYDPLNIKITDLRKGFMLEYDVKTWQVKDEFEFDWGDNFFSYEYHLVAEDGEECFLSIDTEDGLELIISRKVNLHKIGPDLDRIIVENGKPPAKIVFEGRTYYRESESPGFYRNVNTTSREQSVECIVWDYYDESEKFVLGIEQWGDEDFDASYGLVAEEFEFSNILPAGE